MEFMERLEGLPSLYRWLTIPGFVVLIAALYWYFLYQPYIEEMGALHEQWFRQKSGGDSAVSSEFVIAGMIFHHSRVKSELLHK